MHVSETTTIIEAFTELANDLLIGWILENKQKLEESVLCGHFADCIFT
jgi:hypothetical protein